MAASEICAKCGEPLTVVSKIMSRQGVGVKPYRLDIVREQASSIKEQEAVASQRRMATFEDIDRRRAEALAEAQEAQRAHTQRISVILIGVSALFLVAIAILVFMML
jgi:hypothetical protein